MTAFQDWWKTQYPDEQARTRSKHIRALADKSGLSCSTIYTLLRGAALRHIDKAKALSAATDGKVTPGELLGI